jgi:pantetheine-phosphate adenylyltransferase
MSSAALYPGSFDPLTFGHLDIIKRASLLFDRVIVTVAVNTKKSYLFSPDERIALIKDCLKKDGLDNVEVDQFTGLLVDHARRHKVNTLIRGIRQISDFEYEFRMALMNRKLSPEIDTVFLMPREEYTFISATLVREVAYWNGPLEQFVPGSIAAALREKQVHKNQVNGG